MSDNVFSLLRARLGSDLVARDLSGRTRVAVDSADAAAQVCSMASEAGWKVRLAGRGTWLPDDAPADLTLTSQALDQVVSVSPADLVATVQAGATLETIRRQLGEHGMWLAADPPGRSDRTIGSVVATATSGPLRLGFGSIRDHVLGATVVTGDGRVIHAGGRVVKNVAGFDLTRLQVGGFGGFGLLTEFHLRLRALPRADRTVVCHGTRDFLLATSRDLSEAGLTPVAMEIFAPALAANPDWTLAVRFQGAESSVQAEIARLPRGHGVAWNPLPPDRSAAFWNLAGRAALSGPVTVRLGCLPPGLDDTLDLVASHLDEQLVSVGAGDGTVRWTGEAGVEALTALRRALATREIPLTLERAPWEIRKAVGHFGAYREGVSPLVDRLRETWDPAGCFQVALEGERDG